MYLDIRTESQSDNPNEDVLIESIKTLDFDGAIKKTRMFRQKYVTVFGYAPEGVLDIVYNEQVH